MRRLFCLFSLIAAPAFAEVPKVVTDIAPVHGMVSQVMQGVGTPELIVPPGASPHGYAMRPSEARALAGADLIIWVGPLLTPWLAEPIETLSDGAPQLRLMDVPQMVLLPFREGATFEAHDHDHGSEASHDAAHGEAHEEGHEEEHAHAHEEDAHDKHDAHEKEEHDAHDADEKDHDHAAHEGGMDPHIWLDPMNGIAALEAIAERLAQMDPDNADTYRSNSRAGQETLRTVSQELDAMLDGASGIPFLVFHDAYHYFEARFGVEAAGSVSTGEADKPGPARIAELRAHFEQTGAACAFSEPQMDQSMLTTVVEGQDTRLAVLDPLGADLPVGASLYPELLRALGRNMAACLTP